MSAVQVITGLNGGVLAPGGIVARFSAMRVSGGQELAEVSAYGGAGFRTRVPLLADLAGQIIAFLTKGALQDPKLAAIQNTTPSNMTLTWDTGCTLSFGAFVGGYQIVGEYKGLNIVTWDFAKGDDVAPTVAWVST